MEPNSDNDPSRPSLTDSRSPGEWRSRYAMEAWVQIVAEFVYLILLLILVTVASTLIGVSILHNAQDDEIVSLVIVGLHVHTTLLKWVLVGLSGMVGGICFDLKWLYHSVAWNLWNRDRVLWRVIVPYLSGIVATFLGFMIVSGIIPFLNIESFNSIYFGLGFGFLFGYFSDNALAMLHNLAQRIFGTTSLGSGDS